MNASQNVKLAKTLSHPLRWRILMEMNTPCRRMSPKDFSEEQGLSLSGVAYHFKGLHEGGLIRLVETVPRRGATEHYYEPEKRVLAWAEEWAALPKAVKDQLTATLLGGFVEAIGRAIDGGTFAAQDHSHFSWDTIRLDGQGLQELGELLTETMKGVMKIERTAGQRLDGDPGTLVSYGLTAFQSPERGDPK